MAAFSRRVAFTVLTLAAVGAAFGLMPTCTASTAAPRQLISQHKAVPFVFAPTTYRNAARRMGRMLTVSTGQLDGSNRTSSKQTGSSLSRRLALLLCTTALAAPSAYAEAGPLLFDEQ
eukprot:6182494-Pleurochrysis_carterae.AAC.1